LSSSKTSADRALLDLERDLPTTAADVRALRELHQVLHENLLVDVNRLVAPTWSRQIVANRPTFEGSEPFELQPGES
jgi:hypothetical protein